MNCINLPEFRVIKAEENEFDYRFTVETIEEPDFCPQCFYTTDSPRYDGKPFIKHGITTRPKEDLYKKESRKMVEVKHDLLTNNYTRVFHEDKGKFNAPNHFIVTKTDSEKIVAKVDFQEGPCKEVGVNGAGNEDVLIMVLTRLKSFQDSEFRCEENAMAITKLEEALLWLRKRTMSREKRGVVGTFVK